MSGVKINVLIIEHDAIIALDIKSRFEKQGYTVIDTLTSFRQILDNMGSYKNTNLILIDDRLPDFIHEMPAVERVYKSVKVPLILLTTCIDEELKAKCDAYESVKIIEKPFNNEELFDLVKNIFDKVN